MKRIKMNRVILEKREFNFIGCEFGLNVLKSSRDGNFSIYSLPF
jgi:hypothetical protein